jgi:hypothetical protein
MEIAHIRVLLAKVKGGDMIVFSHSSFLNCPQSIHIHPTGMKATRSRL